MKFKNIILFSMLPLLSASCSDDDKQIETPDPISFISEANPYTRMNQEGDQWLAGSKLGVYMMQTGTFTSLENSANVLYTAEADGASAKFTSGSPFTFPEDGSKVDFIGYYPHSAEVNNFIYPVNLVNQSAGSAAHDLMHAKSRSGFSLISTREVPMSFTHQLSKVIFQFRDTDGEVLSPEQLLIKGMNTTAGYDLTTASLQNEATPVDIIPYKTSGGTFEAVVLPFDITLDHAIEYTVNGEPYTWKLADTESKLSAAKAGGKYTFTITHEEGVEPIGTVEVDGSSVSPWQDGESGGNDASAELIINYDIFPANGTTNAYKDTYLKLNFKGTAPEIGRTGKIRVFKADDNTLVDEIDMADTHVKFSNGGALHTKMDIIGAGIGNRYRVVNYQPVTIEDNTATIKLHYNKLEYNTRYYVLIDSRAIRHKDFFGIKDATKWTFTTKEAPAVPTDVAHTVTVGGDNGNADFRTIQAAMDFLAVNIAKDDQKTVFIQNGIYEELLLLRDVNNITIKGENKEGVIIRYNNYDDLNGGTGGSATIDPKAEMGTTVAYAGGRCVFLIEGVDKLRFESLTIENTHIKTGSGDQAEALYVNNQKEEAVAFINCNLLSCQDTLNLKGFCWFYNSLIAGDVDFIWGSPAAALFENCEIRSVNDGYILQARVAENNKGFVFLNCQLTTTGKATSMYLSRTAGNNSFDNITFVKCKMADIYGTYGWGRAGGASGTEPNPSTATLLNGYKVYGCTNLEGGNITINNSQYAYTLTEQEYQDHFSSKEIILAAYAGGVNWFAE